MSDQDLTAPEAVKRFAQMLETDASDQHTQPCEMTGLLSDDEYEIAATLRALSAALEAEKVRAEAAEAKLKKAVEVARFCARADVTVIEKGNRARAFLASLEGDKP